MSVTSVTAAQAGWTVNSPPNGCQFDPETRQLRVSLPMVMEGKIIFMYARSFESSGNALYGCWEVSEDGLHVRKDRVTKTVEALFREHILEVARMVSYAQEIREKDPTQIRIRRWENLKIFTPLALLGVLIVACFIACIIAGIYGPMWCV